MNMVDFVIYGKIIVDEFHLPDGMVRTALGGGGPQAAFGARLWSDSVGLATRSGTDLEAAYVDELRRLDVHLAGWNQFHDIPTPRSRMLYDEDELMVGGIVSSESAWNLLLAQPLELPASYQNPRAIHLITEFASEPMIDSARSLKERGAALSLEPIPGGFDSDGRMLALLMDVDLVSPDWPTACQVAACDDPAQVLRHWSTLGPGAIAVRHGARGSYVWSRGQDEAWHIPPVPVSVVDPTGAGNAYGGGLSVGWVETGDIRRAGCRGAIAASMVVRQFGSPVMSADLRREARSLLDATLQSTRRL
jgi:sugar/nucleoside kinase (ribokinase family)